MFQRPPSSIEKLHQRARPFRKLESIEALVGERRRTAADHVPNVQLRDFIVCEIDRGIAGGLQEAKQIGGLLPRRRSRCRRRCAPARGRSSDS